MLHGSSLQLSSNFREKSFLQIYQMALIIQKALSQSGARLQYQDSEVTTSLWSVQSTLDFQVIQGLQYETLSQKERKEGNAVCINMPSHTSSPSKKGLNSSKSNLMKKEKELRKAAITKHVLEQQSFLPYCTQLLRSKSHFHCHHLPTYHLPLI